MNIDTNSTNQHFIPVFSRRGFIYGLAGCAAATASNADATQLPSPATEHNGNLELIAALQHLLRAQQQYEKEQSDLQWLADEWRHRWPLAPECILGSANVDRHGYDEDAERDLMGRYIYRETAELTTRIKSKSWCQEHPRVCFAVETSEKLRATVHETENRKPKGRTDKARAEYEAITARYLKDYRAAIPVALEYERVTADIRRRSGVDEALARVSASKAAVDEAMTAVFVSPVRNLAGLKAKAKLVKEALPQSMFRPGYIDDMGALGGLFSIAMDAIHLNGGDA
ncbi:hypothetical protein [Rhizobium sp. TRM95796]|uniref:hypothetical protein n=1 Tax=Rhizobium sp. TRM95796 TaxID=2979862 RepID=UPI0021E7339C|nr:hypothetical protein [Rhizobium sp. TRM95796]MCV3764049.1 hypothetical protein [Rhizobium sp. TRM95796]